MAIFKPLVFVQFHAGGSKSYQDAVDQAIDMFDKLMTGVYNQSQQEIDAQLIARRQNLQKALALFKSLGDVILDESVDDDQLRNRLFQAVPKDELTREIQALNGLPTAKMSFCKAS